MAFAAEALRFTPTIVSVEVVDAPTISFTLIGLAILAAGTVGILLPEGERTSALLPLVAGTGFGIVTLALGSGSLDEPEAAEQVFLFGSVLGFAVSIAALAVLWRRTAHRGGAPKER